MHSFSSCLVHCVWSTKIREAFLSSELRDRLWPYLGGIARQNQMKALAIGGATDHVHILLKGNSSQWIHETFPKMRSFCWQEGYGAFSIGVSGIEATTAYIGDQPNHHRTRSFREEFVTMLRRHGFDYEESMLD